jgi:hypothetical protein
VRSLKQANEWVEKEAKRTDLYGDVWTLFVILVSPATHLASPTNHEQTPEGFVVYWNGLPVAKMKNRFYSDKHLLITGKSMSKKSTH